MKRLRLLIPKAIVRTLLFGLLALGAIGIGSSTVMPISVEAVQCLPGQETCAVPGGVVCEGQCYQGKRCTRNDLVPDPTCIQLSITNVSHGTPLTDQATITWATNLAATHVVKYGLSATALTSQQVNTLPMATTHSVMLTNLQPLTTYYYQAFSETATSTDEPNYQKASSSTRNFTTASGAPTGSAPTFTFGPRANAVDTYADITFRTNVQTTALIEYNRQDNQPVDPTSPTYATAADANLSTDHTIRVDNFVQPSQSRRFYYRVTITDSNSNSTALDSYFDTSANSDDHVFTTGGCSDGNTQIAIGQCAADGRYCRTGGQLAYDCRPGISCTTACPSGSTCLANGDCSADPALTGSPTECNPKFCYQKCDGNSGAKSGQACTADSDCVIGPSLGSCVVGSFNNPAVPGCRASWPGCDANVILKVRPDRVCDKWLTCKTSLETTDAFGKKENQCFDLSICDSLSPSGVCNDLLEGGQCENDPLRFCNTDADCAGNGKCRLQASANNIPITYKTPQDVDKIKNLSGYAYAGLDWTEQSGSPQVDGYYPLSFAKQVGQKLDVQNGDFEDTTIQARCSNNPNVDCTNGGDTVCQTPTSPNATCIYKVVGDSLLASLWEGISPAGSANPATASVTVEKEGGVNNPNYFMRVTPTDKAGSGAWTSRAMNLRPSGGSQYLLTLRLRSEQDDWPIQVSLVNEAGQETVLDESPGNNVGSPVKLTAEWKSYRLGPETVGGGLSRLAFKTTVTGTSVTFDVDDVAFLPALQVNDTTRLAQDCRLYPNENAAKCQFLDTNGVLYQGLKGYCLERDPQNSAVCLSWWPVDIISGSNIFEQETNVGYQGRTPLYVCVESNGNIKGVNGVSSAKPYLVGDITYREYSKIENECADSIDSSFKFTIGQCCTGCLPPPANGGSRGVWQAASGPESGLREEDILSVVWSPVAGNTPRMEIINNDQFQRSTSWDNYATSGDYNLGDDPPPHHYVVYREVGTRIIIWNWRTTACNQPADANENCATSQLVFDKTTHKFLGYWLFVDDQTGQTTAQLADTQLYQVYFYTKETCNKLVQVVDSFGVGAAWSDRTSSGSTYIVPNLNYRYISDLQPFGGAAQPSNTDAPSRWSTILSAEGPNIDQSQVRSGSPYACVGNCSAKVCGGDSGQKIGFPCQDSNDCIDTNVTPAVHGSCIGLGLCLEYDKDNKRYQPSSTKESCTMSKPLAGACPAGQTCCSKAEEDCVGGAASGRGAQTFSAAEPGLANQSYAQYRIQRLFAQAFSVWEWDPNSKAYRERTGEPGYQPWQPPETLCRVCSGGSSDSKACTSSASCGANSTCVDADIHPKQNVGSETGADYCAIKPKITQVFDADKQFVPIDEGNPYTLRFTSKVDPEQLPLTKVTIDWGDGSSPTIDPVRIKDRQSESKPHLYAHPYDCQLDPVTGECKPYQIRLQIQDNWGWCDNGVNSNPCPPQTDAARPWTKGPTIQVKRNR